MSHYTSNLLECSNHKLEDRQNINQRVFDALMNDSDARLDFRSPWRSLTPDEEANWTAREHFAATIQSFAKPDLGPIRGVVTDAVFADDTNAPEAI